MANQIRFGGEEMKSISRSDRSSKGVINCDLQFEAGTEHTSTTDGSIPKGRHVTHKCVLRALVVRTAMPSATASIAASDALRFGTKAPIISKPVRTNAAMILATCAPCAHVWGICCWPSPAPQQPVSTKICAPNVSLTALDGMWFDLPMSMRSSNWGKERPRKMWINLPRAPRTLIQNAMQRDELQRVQLTRKRCYAKKMMSKLAPVRATLLSDDAGLDVFCEWPRRHTGHDAMSGLWGKIAAIRCAWLPCRVDRSRSHIKMSDAHAPIHKPWAGMTTCPAPQKALQDRTCIGGRERDHRWGGNFTTCTAYYPQRMRRSITQLWKQHILGDQDPFLTLTTTRQAN